MKLTQNNKYIDINIINLIKDSINENSKIGDEIREYLESSKKTISDELKGVLISNFIRNNLNKSIIFDGYPETYEQTILLDKLLEDFNRKISYVIHLNLNNKMLLDRCIGRRVHINSRRI